MSTDPINPEDGTAKNAATDSKATATAANDDEAKGTGAKSTEAKSTEAKSAEAESTEAKSAEAESAEAESAEAESTEAESTEAKSAGADKAAPKSVWAKDADDPSAATDLVATLEDEIADLNDQLLRALAEAENVRRRARKEKEDTGRFAISDFARDMLGIADNLHRAIETIPDAVLSEDHELNGFYQGVQLVERDVLQAFERHGIVQISPLGEKFDHNFHQAMFEIEDHDAEPGTVVQLMAPGYVIHGRLLRPAMVGLAKAGPKKDAEARGATGAAKDGKGPSGAADTPADADNGNGNGNGNGAAAAKGAKAD